MKKIILLSALLTLLFFSAGCTKKAIAPTVGNDSANTVTGQEQTAVYTLEEVGIHATAEDCWLAINGKVYDVGKFVTGHPGGQAILEGCGKDATQLFETRPMGSKTPHSERAQNILPKYYIGELAK
jgi:cytochrome b involved in lipid metabolism